MSHRTSKAENLKKIGSNQNATKVGNFLVNDFWTPPPINVVHAFHM